MQLNTRNIQKGFLLEQKELLEYSKKLSKYFNKETIEMLKSLISLDESVFKHINFFENFHSMKLLYEIAKYNICNHTIKTIENMSDIDNNHLKVVFFGETITISYKEHKNDVFYANLATTKNKFGKIEKNQPEIYLYEEKTPIEEQIGKLERKIKELENTKYGSDKVLMGYDGNNKPIFDVLVGGQNAQKYIDVQFEIERLKEMIENLEKVGNNYNICNNVSNELINHWCIELEEELFSDNLVKKLSWITISKSIK